MTNADQDDFWQDLASPLRQPEPDVLFSIARHTGDTVAQCMSKMTAPQWIVADGAAIDGLTERLEVCGLEHHCLFPSSTLKEAAGAAPWLIQIDPENAFARSLLDQTPGAHWSIWTSGIMLSSTMPGSALAQHLKKRVLRTRPKNGRTFHRFWEPAAVFDYFSALHRLPDRARELFHSAEGSIEGILARDIARDRTVFVLNSVSGTHLTTQFQHDLDPVELEGLLASVLRPFAPDMAQRLLRSDPETVGHLSALDFEDALTESCVRLHGYGFRKVSMMRELALQDIWMGGPFEMYDPQLHEICTCDLEEDAKYAALRDAIAASSQPGSL